MNEFFYRSFFVVHAEADGANNFNAMPQMPSNTTATADPGTGQGADHP